MDENSLAALEAEMERLRAEIAALRSHVCPPDLMACTCNPTSCAATALPRPCPQHGLNWNVCFHQTYPAAGAAGGMLPTVIYPVNTAQMTFEIAPSALVNAAAGGWAGQLYTVNCP